MSDKQLQDLEVKASRDRRWKRIIVTGSVIIALLALLTLFFMTAKNAGQLAALRTEADRSDTAAVEVAQEKQDQARSLKALCESGAIKQDERGKAVCEQAKRDASEDPEKAVEQRKGQPADEGAQGPQGPQGPPGAPGVGTPGKPGAQGPPGAPGTPGRPGDQGPQGPPGIAGAVGKAGVDGIAGARGEPGAPGNDGSDGAPGEPGADGAKGAPGNDGADGADGKDGAAGPVGPKGDTGATGPAGPKGDPGAPGADGKPGAPGTDGRGITSAQCGADGRWTLTWSTGETTDAGQCLMTQAPAPAPTTDTPPTTEVPTA